ncbi:MAG TPA: hypothetical protein VK108_00655 [Pseudogracilibacillus sp.]|nr:hypothetical protein [Pseudogracilibacillus sp.]HLR53394.1 hypothetical protein [Pseudogracilibacillus sp.]
MKKLVGNFAKVIVSYLAVILVIMLTPIFLISNDTSVLDGMMDFIFEHKF